MTAHKRWALGAGRSALVADAAGDVARCHMACRGVDVAGLVVEEEVGFELARALLRLTNLPTDSARGMLDERRRFDGRQIEQSEGFH